VMFDRIIKVIFFGNYFIGILAIALSIESCIQLRLPFNSIAYYGLLFSATVMYYSYAYRGAAASAITTNTRTEWYTRHHRFAQWNLGMSFLVCLVLGTYLITKYHSAVGVLPLEYWLIIGMAGIAGLLYYGLVPPFLHRLNLRNTGWLKAFVIGFVWACCVNLLPLVMLKIEGAAYTVDPVFIVWLFIKNWMFCTVNAIMFDMKDYDEDANKQLKTFVVQFGIRRTIFYVLFPLLLAGVLALAIFVHFMHFGLIPFLINLLPYLLLLVVAYSMHTRKNILFYLIVIDGMLLVKALCGMIAMQFIVR